MYSSLIFCTVFHDSNWLPYSRHTDKSDLSIFRIHVPQFVSCLDYLHSLLKPEEETRKNKYRFERDQQRFVVTRGILRILLGQHADQSPKAIGFTVGSNKKPQLNCFPDLHYNVSHSGDWILIGIANRTIGVDLEKINTDFLFQDVIAYSFSEAEKTHLAMNQNNSAVFYQLWTRKEAFVKATGQGIDANFNRIPCLNGNHPVDSDKSWLVSSFNVAENYVATVAYPVESVAATINFYDIDHSLLNHEFNETNK